MSPGPLLKLPHPTCARCRTTVRRLTLRSLWPERLRVTAHCHGSQESTTLTLQQLTNATAVLGGVAFTKETHA